MTGVHTFVLHAGTSHDSQLIVQTLLTEGLKWNLGVEQKYLAEVGEELISFWVLTWLALPYFISDCGKYNIEFPLMKVHRTIIHLKGKNGNAIFFRKLFYTNKQYLYKVLQQQSNSAVLRFSWSHKCKQWTSAVCHPFDVTWFLNSWLLAKTIKMCCVSKHYG